MVKFTFCSPRSIALLCFLLLLPEQVAFPSQTQAKNTEFVAVTTTTKTKKKQWQWPRERGRKKELTSWQSLGFWGESLDWYNIQHAAWSLEQCLWLGFELRSVGQSGCSWLGGQPLIWRYKLVLWIQAFMILQSYHCVWISLDLLTGFNLCVCQCGCALFVCVYWCMWSVRFLFCQSQSCRREWIKTVNIEINDR